MQAPPPPNEAQRLKATEDYAVNGQPSDGEFDAVVALAAEICETPIAVVSFIGETEMWLRASHGYRDWSTSPREQSFCAHNLQGSDLLVVPDAAADPRFAQNPFVTGAPNIRFYASAPIITRTGETLGALCVIDRVPRQLAERQLAALSVLSRQVMTALELRRELTERKRAETLKGVEARALESISEDQPLPEVLRLIALGVEEIMPETIASIMLLEPGSPVPQPGVAPHLPETLQRAGAVPATAAAATALAHRRPVVVTDIEADGDWAGQRELARSHGCAPAGRCRRSIRRAMRSPPSPCTTGKSASRGRRNSNPSDGWDASWPSPWSGSGKPPNCACWKPASRA